MSFRTVPAPVTLTGTLVELRPLEREHHDALIDAASEGHLWESAWYTSVASPETMMDDIENRLSLQEKGEMIPFTTFDAAGTVIGMTTLYDLNPLVPRLHIGYTWNRVSAQGSGTNVESKYLLLRHAFEELGVYRVGLTTQWLNFQSRAAIERLGAKQDGVLRAYSRARNGTLRDAVEYSILELEWEAVKAHLEARMAKRG